jgi:hypothetical protein
MRQATTRPPFVPSFVRTILISSIELVHRSRRSLIESVIPFTAKPLGAFALPRLLRLEFQAFDIFNVPFLSMTDCLSLRIGFRTKWPWPFEAAGLRIIGLRADSYVVARLSQSDCSTLQVDGRMRSRCTSDVGARGERC